MHVLHRTKLVALAACATMLASLAFITPALADVSVTLNGAPLQLAPGPITRGGRVFVPLRGVFEKLGATVVYYNGTINATGNGRTISLHIGSNQATVNGQPQNVDVAPFIVGASTYVPLRFVGQALGATVDWDNANQIVALTSNGAAPVQNSYNPPPQATQPPQQSSIRLTNVQPTRNASVASRRPTISADFSGNVDPNSVRVALDGLDVSAETTRSQQGIIFAPPSPLQSMQHTVQITGRDQNGIAFSRQWTFTTGGTPVSVNNTLVLTAPADGATVDSTFVIRGHTAPGARVHIVAGATGNFAGVFAYGAGTYVGDVIADGNGNFAQQVSMQSVSGATIVVTVTSTDPQNGETAQQRVRLQER